MNPQDHPRSMCQELGIDLSPSFGHAHDGDWEKVHPATLKFREQKIKLFDT